MTLLAVERIKLFSTRSPFWCVLVALGLTVGLAAMMSLASQVDPSVAGSQFGYNFGLMVMMVMATLAVTTEYRFNTIRTTFQAVPNRTRVLLAKTAVVGLLAALVGLLAAFGSLAMTMLLRPGAELAIQTEQQWRMLLGMGLFYLVGALIAVAVGILVRQSAAAVALVLIYPLMIESLIGLIPNVGEDIAKWTPFTVGKNFLAAGDPNAQAALQAAPGIELGAWASLGYFAAFAAVLLGVALAVANRRDA